MVVCPACGSENLDDARFCSYCGRPLAGRPAEAERKLVTVLFADVTGSTPLGEQLDPEDLKDVLGAFADAMREEIEAEGGTLEKFIGDAVMAAFGVPVAHEDDAARALASSTSATASASPCGSGSTPARCSRRATRGQRWGWSPETP
jgi:class 3 adenylate cyclase